MRSVFRLILLALTMVALAAPADAAYPNGQVLAQQVGCIKPKAQCTVFIRSTVCSPDDRPDADRMAGQEPLSCGRECDNAIGKSGGPPQPAVWALRGPSRLA
jgi:hypothetical protein